MAEKKQTEQAQPQRVSPQQAREQMQAGALLVCAYDDAEKCAKYHLHGSISLEEFKSHEDTVAKDRELIFYCA